MYDLVFTSLAKYSTITKKHVHTGWEIVCYHDCNGTLFIEDEAYPFQHGSIFVIPPNLAHYEIAGSEMTIACFSVKSLYCLDNKVYSFTDNSNNDFAGLFRQLNAANNLKPQNWEKIQDGLLNVMEQYIISWNYSVYQNELVHQFQYQLIEALSVKDIDMDEMIRSIPVSNSYFRKLFKAETGKPPMQYLLEQRIGKAKQLLAGTSMSIKNIANLVGYNDPYYFSRSFKKATGKFPSQWRAGK